MLWISEHSDFCKSGFSEPTNWRKSWFLESSISGFVRFPKSQNSGNLKFMILQCCWMSAFMGSLFFRFTASQKRIYGILKNIFWGIPKSKNSEIVNHMVWFFLEWHSMQLHLLRVVGLFGSSSFRISVIWCSDFPNIRICGHQQDFQNSWISEHPDLWINGFSDACVFRKPRFLTMRIFRLLELMILWSYGSPDFSTCCYSEFCFPEPQ